MRNGTRVGLDFRALGTWLRVFGIGSGVGLGFRSSEIQLRGFKVYDLLGFTADDEGCVCVCVLGLCVRLGGLGYV